METEHGNEIFVEVNSLEDFSNGKKLFNGHEALIQKGHTPIEFVSMGVLEGGTKKGKTSLMFLLLEPTTKTYSIAQMPYSIFQALATMAANANSNFRSTKHNNSPTMEKLN